MWYWIGVYLLVSGALALIFNEFTMRLRRVWPWRRDDSNPARDKALNEFYRLWVYLGSIASIEIGLWLTAISFLDVPLRVAIYLGFGAWLLWRRPGLRRKAFWLALPFRGWRPGP